MNSFLSACSWLENETTVHSLKEFRAKVQELLSEGTAYTSKYLKKLLSSHYGSHISFSYEHGKPTSIYLVNMAKFIIESRNKQRSENTEREAENILQSAALLIKTDIREKKYSNEYYPTNRDITENWIPESLRTFLSYFSSSQVKQESIGQAIVKLVSPVKIPPIHFG